jgi:hypothetical protein
MGRRLELQRNWFAELRSVARQMAMQDQAMLLIPGTAAAMYAQRAAELYGGRRVVLMRDGECTRSWHAWLDVVRRRMLALEPFESHVSRGWVSPPLARWEDRGQRNSGQPSQECRTPDGRTRRPRAEGECEAVIPVQDLLLAALAEQWIVLSAKRGGNIERIIDGMLGQDREEARQVYLTSDSNRIPGVLRERWVGQGAKLLEPVQDEGVVEEGAVVAAISTVQPRQHSWRNVTELTGTYLTHCTRGRFGPWPGQSENEYLDDLLLNRPSADHGPLATLRRIIAQRRLMAASGVVRGDGPVVCFSAVPPGELAQLRRFRPHRCRWDFEPYGIALAMAPMLERGARPVIYGDERVWISLPEELRPFFQLRSTHTAQGNVWDWSVEQEWRYVGDVDLSEFDAQDVVVIVKCAEAAQQVFDICPWEVCLVGGGELAANPTSVC